MQTGAIASESSARGRRLAGNESNMSKADIPKEVDFRGARRGVYAARYAAATNTVVLDEDVARKFKSSEQVNRVLRTFIAAAAEIGPAKRSATPKSSARRAARRKSD